MVANNGYSLFRFQASSKDAAGEILGVLSFFHVYFEYVDKTKTTNFAKNNNKAIQE